MDLVVGSSLTVPGAAVVDDGSTVMLHTPEIGSFMKHVTYTFPTKHASEFRSALGRSNNFASWPLHTGEYVLGNGPTTCSSLPAVAPAVDLHTQVS